MKSILHSSKSLKIAFFALFSFIFHCVTAAPVGTIKVWDTENFSYYTEKDTVENHMTYYNDIYYIAKGQSIYCKNGNSGNWYRYLDSDNYLKYVWKDNDGVYMSDEYFNKFQINQEIDSIKPYYSKLTDLDNKQIKTITFKKGSIGCFHNVSTEITYKRKSDHFSKSSKKVKGKKAYFLKKMPSKIEFNYANDLLYYAFRSICNLNDTISLELTEQERQNYKIPFNEELEMVTEFRMDTVFLTETDKESSLLFRLVFDPLDYMVDKNTFEYLSSCIDTFSFNKHSQELLSTENYSVCTTTNYNVVNITMEDGNTLILKDSKFNPNYLHCPWLAFYNGEPFLLKSMAVGKCIDDMTNGKFMPECNSKEYAVGKLLKYYYNQKRK